MFLYNLHSNSRLHFLYPLSPSTYIYSYPFPPFLLTTEELANSKVDSKFVSAEEQATDDPWVYCAAFPWAEGLTWAFLLLPAIHSHDASRNSLLNVCLHRLRAISRFKNNMSDWQGSKIGHHLILPQKSSLTVIYCTTFCFVSFYGLCNQLIVC